MVQRALLVWSAAAVVACGTAAVSSTSLLWHAPVPAVSMTPRDAPVEPVDPVVVAVADAAPARGFMAEESVQLSLPVPGFATVSLFDPASSASAGFTSLTTIEDARPVPAPESRAAIREIVREEITTLDPALTARLAVRPPPRPAFIEVANRAEPATEAGILEMRTANASPSWPEGAGPGLWSGLVAPPSDRPLARHERALQSGMASWYGPGFHGRKTASGERFDQNALTAAHRSLPFGTRVRVVDQKTGRSIVVRINDRGPFAHGRVIDLSKGSAEALGMGGLARVQIVSAE